MRTSYLLRITFYLMIILVLCFTFHVPISISLAEPRQTQTGKPQYLCRIGTIAPAGISYVKYISKKLRELEELTDHRVKFKVYAGGVLGDEPAMIKLVREGKIDGVFVTPFALELVAPESLVLSLPNLFRDEDEMDFIMEKYEPLLAGYARERGIEILGLFPYGSVQIFSTIPILRPDELRDRKVMCVEKSQFFSELFRILGWNTGVSLPISKVESALSSGKVEVVFTNAAGAVILGWYPYIRYAVMQYFCAGIAVFFVNSAWYHRLPGEVRSNVAKFIREQRKKMLKWGRRDDEIAMLGLMKRGVNIIRWSPEDMEKQRKAAKTFWDVGAGKWYPRKLLDDIVRDLEDYRAAKGTIENKH